MADSRTIIAGEPGTTWKNDTDRPWYQFRASLINTCGVCLQYHLQLARFWPIPLHPGCRCRQVPVKPGTVAPEPFADFRKILDGMAPSQQAAAIGRSCYRLLKAGIVPWDEIVTAARVRSLREIVSRN